MTTRVAVTKRDAEKVLVAVREKYAAYLGGGADEPVLIKDWDWTGYGGAPYSIVWEGGPYEWAVSFMSDDVDEEMAELAAEFGLTVGPSPVPDLPDTVWTEPITGWALGIYRK